MLLRGSHVSMRPRGCDSELASADTSTFHLDADDTARLTRFLVTALAPERER